MKKLVLGSLMLAAIASQATGCIITSDPDPEAAIVTADWTFVDVNAQGLTTTTPCPAGFGTVALHNQELDANDVPIGLPIIDLFDCIDGRHSSAPLDPVVYETWIEVTDGSGAGLYAESLSQISDVRDVDAVFSTDITNNGGHFQVAWNLQGASSNRALSCADVGALRGIEITATLSGTASAVSDQFDCENGVDFSAPVMSGTYVVSVAAINSQNLALGQPTDKPNEIMGDRNQVTNLGTVTLPIDNL